MIETKKFEPRVKEKFIFLLLQSIEDNGDNRGEIAKSINKTKQALSYHLNKLRRIGLIQKDQSYPYAIYSLTPLGKRIKQNLTQSEQPKTLYRCHAKIVGFDIMDFGNYKWNVHKKCQMNNWFYEEDKVKDSIGEWKINIQSTGLLKIYCPEIYHEHPPTAFGMMHDISSRIAEKFRSMYGMKIGLLKVIREGHKELVNSDMLAKLFGKTKIGNVWIDASTGTEWLEAKETDNSLEKLMDMPNRLGLLEDHLVKQTEIMDRLSDNIKLHLEVMTNMNETLKKIQESLKR